MYYASSLTIFNNQKHHYPSILTIVCIYNESAEQFILRAKHFVLLTKSLVLLA